MPMRKRIIFYSQNDCIQTRPHLQVASKALFSYSMNSKKYAALTLSQGQNPTEMWVHSLTRNGGLYIRTLRDYSLRIIEKRQNKNDLKVLLTK